MYKPLTTPMIIHSYSTGKWLKEKPSAKLRDMLCKELEYLCIDLLNARDELERVGRY